MRCKKHLQDLTSTIGVCASCLRDRLQPLFEAQAQAQHARVCPRSSDDLKNPDHDDSIGLNFPRSVSPYVSRRKTDRDRRLDRSFYSTPMMGPAFPESCDGGKTTSSKKKKRLGKFWILSNLFQSGSNKSEISSRESRDPSSSSAAASPSWLSTILPGRRRGCEESDRGSSSENKICEDVDQSPWGNQMARRSRLGSAGKTISGMVICLSPLVRASPNRHWNQKGMMAQDSSAPVGGAHNHTSYCANRSRKFADFGRVTHNR